MHQYVMMQPTTSDGGSSSCDMDDDKMMIQIESSDAESSGSDIDVETTHPAVLIVFRTENILEEICSHLEFNDAKQFRLVSRTCNDEGRRTLTKRDEHWLVVESKLGQVLRELEETSTDGDGGENPNRKLLGWIFKRLDVHNWYHSLGHPSFLQQWGHYLRKIHLKVKDHADWTHGLGVSHVITTMHNLLSVCCPNLDELVLVVAASYVYVRDVRVLPRLVKP